MTAALGGGELATEWVTLLPETATLAKRLREFKPRPIKVQVEADYDEMEREGQAKGKRTGQKIDTEVDRETRGTGRKVAHNISDGLEDKEVTNAAQRVGRAIRYNVEGETRKIDFKSIGKGLFSGLGATAGASMQILRNVGTIATVLRFASRAAKMLSISMLAAATATKVLSAGVITRVGVALGFAAHQANRLATQVARVTSAVLVLAAVTKLLSFMHSAAKIMGILTVGTVALVSAGSALVVLLAGPLQSALLLTGSALGIAAGAAAGLLGPAIGVAKLAFSGLSDAAKEFNKNFKDSDELFNKNLGEKMAPLLNAFHELKQGVTLAFANAIEPAFTWLGGATKKIQPRLEGLATTMGNLGGEIAGALNFKVADGTFDKMIAASDRFFQSFLGESGVGGLTSGLVDFAATAADTFSGVGGKINELMLKAGEFLRNVTPAQMKATFATIQAALTNIWNIAKPILNVFKQLGETGVAGLSPGFKAFGDAIKQATPGIINMAKIIMPALGKVMEKLAPALPALVAAFTPWSQILAVIAPVVADLVAKLAPFAPMILAVATAVKVATIAMALYNTAMLLLTNYTRIATAVQWLWNTAFAASGIGTIIVAVVALSAALWAFFTKTEVGRKLWTKIWTGIKTTVDKVWTWIKVEGGKLWESLKPGLESLWATIQKVFGQLKTAFQELWPKIQPVIEGIGKAWLAIQKVNFTVLITALKALGTAIGWAITNVAIPMFKMFVSAAQNAWTILKGVFSFIQGAWEVLWFAIRVAWEAGKRVFDAVGSVLSAVWNGILSPIFDQFKAVWDFLVQKLQWFGDVWTTVWDGLKAGVQAVWDFLKPVRDWLGDFFDSIGALGAKAADGIKAAWSGVANVLKAPLHAMGTFLQGLPDKVLGVPIPFVSDLKGWGQSLAALAGGGIIRGPGTGTSDSILGVNGAGIPQVRVSNGEGIVPEAAMATPIGKQLFGMLLNLPAFATGGRIGQFMSQADNAAYQMGGFSMSAFDCSGLVSAMVNVSMGREWNQGPPGGSARTATGGEGAWLASQGFQKGAGQSNTLRVGFKNGGAGGGHTAGTLPDGTNFESTSGGVRFGGSTGAASFPEQYFLPNNGPEDPNAQSIAGSPLAGAFGPSGVYGGGAGGSGGGGGSGSGGGGSYVVDPKKVREGEDRVTDMTNALDIKQKKLDEYLAKQAAGEKVSDTTIEAARDAVAKQSRELEEAKTDLETIKQGKYVEGKSSGKGSEGGSDDWSSVGGMIFNGFLESMGFDGSVFKNLFDTPNVKSGMAALNWGLGMLAPQDGENAGAGAPQDLGLGSGGGGILGVGTEMLAGIGEQAGVNVDHGTPGTTPGPGNAGPTFIMPNAQLGVSPGAFDDKVGEMTAASKRYPTVGP